MWSSFEELGPRSRQWKEDARLGVDAADPGGVFSSASEYRRPRILPNILRRESVSDGLAELEAGDPGVGLGGFESCEVDCRAESICVFSILGVLPLPLES